jgi:hypothetical protein
MTSFNNLRLATRIVTITLVILFGVVTVNYLVFTTGYSGRAREALVEKAKAFTARQPPPSNRRLQRGGAGRRTGQGPGGGQARG